jgi:predicted ester cyclase
VPETPERNKEIVRTFIEEAQNAHSHERADELVVDDIVLVHPAMRKPARGRETLRLMAEELWLSFPDFRFEIEDMVADGDYVAVRFTAHATNDGPLGPAKSVSGNRMAQPGMTVYRLENGKIAEGRIQEDIYGMLEQLKLVPGTPRLLYWMKRLGIVFVLQKLGKIPREGEETMLG